MDVKYFNNAGAGLMSKNTFKTVVDHMTLETEIGAYKAALAKATDIGMFYSLSAQLINAASKEEIAYVDSASRGWNMVMYGLDITENDTIVTLSSEYGTNLLTIYDIARKTGCHVKIIECTESGEFDINDVEKALKAGSKFLFVSHVAAQGSIVNPVDEMGQLATQYGAVYIVDGCQAVGQLDVDVQRMGCHAYVTAGRKWLRGPRGTGILYVKKGAPIYTPQIDLASADLVFDGSGNVTGLKIRDDAKQFELWERSVASLLGLTNAISECISYGVDNIAKEVVSKADIIREHIVSNKNVSLVGKLHSATGVASFYLRDSTRENEIKERFERNNIIISIVCDWDCPIAFPKTGVSNIFRISPHYYTPHSDIQRVCRFIDNI